MASTLSPHPRRLPFGISVPREGLHLTPLLHILNSTLLSPHLLLPLTLYLHTSTSTYSRLSKYLFAYSLLYRLNSWLNHWTRNNWTKNDDWNEWSKELVVVTGGSNGIGASVAQELGKRGIKVIVVDIEPPKYPTGDNIHYYPCDLTNPAAIRSLTEKIKRDQGDPTVLINNAGITRGRLITDSQEHDLALTMGTNLLAHFHLLRALLPSMIKANHGHIITVASLAGYLGPPGLIDYASSKAGAIALHEGLSLELAAIHHTPRIRTSLIIPSYVKTPMFAGETSNQPWFLMPMLHTDTVAEAIVERVVSGYAATVFLPGFMSIMALVKAMPYWVQAQFGKDAGKTDPKNFLGRQVLGEDGRLVVVNK